MSPTSQRPFWKRKRWIAAAVLWLVVAYLLAPAPICYLWGRGWIADAVIGITEPPYLPVSIGLSAIPGTFRGRAAVGWWREWNSSWVELGRRHRAASN